MSRPRVRVCDNTLCKAETRDLNPAGWIVLRIKANRVSLGFADPFDSDELDACSVACAVRIIEAEAETEPGLFRRWPEHVAVGLEH